MTAARRIAFGFLLAFGFALLLVAANRESILRSAGAYLVEAHAPAKADAILVLAGDYSGARILRGAELVKEGFAPAALVSGPFRLYGVNEADLAIQFAVRAGAPARSFEAVYIEAYSTAEEAGALAPEFRRRNLRKVLLVTSDFHTRRAASIFRRTLGSSVEVLPIAAPSPHFKPESWWHNREGRKIVFYEYTRTLAAWLGL